MFRERKNWIRGVNEGYFTGRQPNQLGCNLWNHSRAAIFFITNEHWEEPCLSRLCSLIGLGCNILLNSLEDQTSSFYHGITHYKFCDMISGLCVPKISSHRVAFSSSHDCPRALLQLTHWGDLLWWSLAILTFDSTRPFTRTRISH